jgi:hypothetical protein
MIHISLFSSKITSPVPTRKEIGFVCNRIQYFSTIPSLWVVLFSTFRWRSKTEKSAPQWILNQVAVFGTDLDVCGIEVPYFHLLFCSLLRSKVEKLIAQWLNNCVRTFVRDCLPSFCDSYNPLSKNRVFCWYITTKSENQYKMHRLHRNQSRKILQNIPYKPTSNTFLINSRLFATDNRFPV